MHEYIKSCPFCRQPIHEDAIKCHHCQSSLARSDGPSQTEKIAELVIKSVGAIPIIMALLLVIAGLYGIRTLSDVHDFAKRAEDAAKSIETQNLTLNKIVIAQIARDIDRLLNELSIDSAAPRADQIRADLRERLAALKQNDPIGYESDSRSLLLQALFAYYDKQYDLARQLLNKTNSKELNKFRLLGIVLLRKAAQSNNSDEVRTLQEEADRHFAEAQRLARREKRTIYLLDGNRAGSLAMLGQYKEAERIQLSLIEKDKEDVLNYYNLAAIYALWGKLEKTKLDKALDALDKGIEHGLDKSENLTKQSLDDEKDFANLRIETAPLEIRRRYTEIRKRFPDK